MRDTSPTAEHERLTALFSPRSVAVVGASDDRDRLSGRPVRYLIDAGYAGRIYPVNPKRATVQGMRAYPDIASLPETPDVALIVVPAAAVVDAIRACAHRGVAGAYLLSGGFAERGEEGHRLQQEVYALASAAGMRLLGPNCLGAFNARDRFFGSFATSLERGLPAPGPVAILSQSGAYGQHLAYLMHRRGLGVGFLITTGNEVDVELAECLEWITARPEIGVIAVYAEGVRNGSRFLRSLEAARLARKAVIVVKVGASSVGARAAASHTAALSGADEVYTAAIRQSGAYRARSTEEQVDVAYVCSHARGSGGRRLGIVSVSGGFGVQAADAAVAAGMTVPPLAPAARTRLGQALGTIESDNPVDVTGQAVNDLGMLASAFAALSEDSAIDSWLVCLTTVPLAAALRTPLCDVLRTSTDRLRARAPVAVVCIADAETIATLEADGFLVFEDIERAVRALAAWTGCQQSFARDRRAPVTGVPADRRLTMLSEVASKAMLRAAGIATLPEQMVATSEAAEAAARTLGYPVALKVVSAQIPHKTEIEGVMLDVADAAGVRRGFDELTARARRLRPDSHVEGILVSPMAPPGVETIMGTHCDPTFGPVLMFGLGGVLAECMRDVALRIAPVNAEEARGMIAETRASALLAGWRGRPPADIDATVDALVALSEFAITHRNTVASVDINPFLVLPQGQGAVALDALVAGRA